MCSVHKSALQAFKERDFSASCFFQSLVNITYTGHCVVFVSEEVVCLHQMGPVGTFSGLR